MLTVNTTRSSRTAVDHHSFQSHMTGTPLPVMVGYDGRQRSHTYPVAHQMDFLAQNIFNPARSKQQRELLFVFFRGEKKYNIKFLPSVWQ